MPTELRREALALTKSMASDDTRTARPRSHVDDEYAMASLRMPKVCVSTSRDPSARLKAFAKEVRLIFPNSQRVNRGNSTTEELIEACRRADFTDVVVLQETRGEPDALIVSHMPFGPTVFFSLSNPVLRHDLEDPGHVSEAFPHIIVDNFTSPVGLRVASVLRHLFPAPKADSKRVVTFANREDYISFRHHVYAKDPTRGKEAAAAASADSDGGAAATSSSSSSLSARAAQVVLTEVGPRFELRPFQIRLGTLDQDTAEVEWVLHSYTNTAAKRAVL